jgi:ubiquinone/menaquinone biosynthesis C-methylase UbiE
MTTAAGSLRAPARAGAGVDYEAKLWGAHEVEPTPRFLGGLRLRYCLDDLVGVRGKVLEVGCGAGAMARAIQRHRPDLLVFGMDLSRHALEAAKLAGGKVRYTAGDAHRLPLASGSFEAIVVLDVLEHLPDPAAALAEIHRLLRPGGTFHLFCPVEGDLRCLHGILRRFGWRAKERLIGHIQQFTEHGLNRLLQGAGFSVEASRKSGHLLNQVADTAYFTLIQGLGRGVPRSVEGYLESSTFGGAQVLIRQLKNMISVASYWESALLSDSPGSGVHSRSIAVPERSRTATRAERKLPELKSIAVPVAESASEHALDPESLGLTRGPNLAGRRETIGPEWIRMNR